MTSLATISTLLGVALSAMIPLGIVLLPIYFLFIKPALAKRSQACRGSTTAKSNSTSSSSTKSTKRNLLIEQSNTVPVEDMAYLAKVLSPDSTHMDVLLAVLTTPENIEWSIQDLERANNARQERIEKEKKLKETSSKKNKAVDNTFDDVLNEDGWADDDDDTDAATLRAKKAEEERKLEMERLKEATGQALQLIEGIDDGVLGQQWVEKTLMEHKVWPPKDLRFITNTKYEYNGQSLSPMDHPGLRRLLCMTVGRLNSIFLNGHPELLEAGSKKLIDQTYFRSSMEFRQRAGIVLEAALRVGMLVRSSRLVSVILETVCMFKIGTGYDEKAKSWFNNLMMKQYNILPRLAVVNQSIQTPDDDTYIVCGDISRVHVEVERAHAENFLRQKVAMFEKQGIPPEVGLATYREGWWFLLQMKRLDGPTPVEETSEGGNGIFSKDNPAFKELKIDVNDLHKFEIENVENRLITAWPLIVQKVEQKAGIIEIHFKAPSVPGKYRYTLSLKSQDFLGADHSVDIDITVVDTTTAGREPRLDPKLREDENENPDNQTHFD